MNKTRIRSISNLKKSKIEIEENDKNQHTSIYTEGNITFIE